VPLDQPLVVTFAEPLGLPVRPSSVTVLRSDGTPCPDLQIEARGPILLLHPRLPCQADLADGSLPPGSDLRIRLAGLPRLQALRGEAGSLLRGDLHLSLRTSPAAEPAALSGFPSAGDAIRVLDRSDSGLVRLPGLQGPAPRLRFSSALDPRSLLAPARLRPDARAAGGGAAAEERDVALRLIRNEPDGAELALELGDWTGRASLLLPDGIEGPGGRPLEPAAHLLRIWRLP
jgi:hypothetical protein